MRNTYRQDPAVPTLEAWMVGGLEGKSDWRNKNCWSIFCLCFFLIAWLSMFTFALLAGFACFVFQEVGFKMLPGKAFWLQNVFNLAPIATRRPRGSKITSGMA